MDLGIQPQAEQPFGRLAGPFDVSALNGQLKCHEFAALHHRVVQGLDGVDQGECVLCITQLLPELCQFQPKFDIVGCGLDGAVHRYRRLVLFIFPPM